MRLSLRLSVGRNWITHPGESKENLLGFLRKGINVELRLDDFVTLVSEKEMST